MEAQWTQLPYSSEPLTVYADRGLAPRLVALTMHRQRTRRQEGSSSISADPVRGLSAKARFPQRGRGERIGRRSLILRRRPGRLGYRCRLSAAQEHARLQA